MTKRHGSARLARPRRCGFAIVLVLTMGAGRAAAQETVRVTSPDAAVYLQPDSTSAVIVKLAAGAVLDVQKKTGDWYAVLLPPDPQGLRRYGFVAANAVQPLRKPGEPSAGTPSPAERPPEDPDIAFSQVEPGRWAHEGVYLGMSVAFHRLRGGPELLRETQSSDLLFFPGVDNHSGFAVSFGQDFERTAFELSYARSTHAAPAQLVIDRFGGAQFVGQTVYQRIDVDYKRYIARDWRAQPYLRAGFGFPFFTVKQGAIVGGTNENATFSGIGFQLGAGLTVIAHSRIAAQLGATYRYDLFRSARGGGGDWGEVLGIVSLRGLNVTTGMSFMF